MPPLSAAQIGQYRQNGHLMVRGLLDRDALLAARAPMQEAFERHWPKEHVPLAARTDAYSRAFVQITGIGLREPELREVAHPSAVIAAAAQLMQAERVRLYCEDWLLKEPDAPRTPWHQDRCVVPMVEPTMLTAWIPLADVEERDGLLRVARASHRAGLVPFDNLSDESDEVLGRMIEERGLEVQEVPPLRAGDVSFHDGLTFHSAGPNRSPDLRVVLALHLFADGARIAEPTTETMRHQLRNFAPELAPGDLAASDKWCLVYGAS